MLYAIIAVPVHIGSAEGWFENLTNIIAVSVAAYDLTVSFNNHYRGLFSTKNNKVLPMEENTTNALITSLDKSKKSILKLINSFYFRGTLFLLGTEWTSPLPICTGYQMLSPQEKVSTFTITEI